MFLSQSTHSVRLCGRACLARAGLTRRHTRFWKEIAPSLWLANWKIQYGASTFLLVKISSFHLLFYPTETKHRVRAGVFAMRFSNALSCTQNYAPLILCISIMQCKIQCTNWIFHISFPFQRPTNGSFPQSRATFLRGVPPMASSSTAPEYSSSEAWSNTENIPMSSTNYR